MLKRIEADGRARGGAANPVAVDLPKTVLVADDNVVSQQVAERYLEAIGCNVMVVEDGNAAVEACARQEFGLVLMDLQMPKMDGIQATQEIRRRERPGRHVPILALIAKSASDELARCTAAGMNGLLAKPLDMTRLRRALDRFGLTRRTLELPAQSANEPGDPVSEPVDLMTLHAKFSGDLAFVRHLCQSFVTSTNHGLEKLDSAVAAGERTRVRLLAHKIKGSSSVYAHRLAAIAANIESEALTAAMPELAGALDSLRKAFDEAILHIGARLS